MLWAATPQPAYSTTPAASSSAAMASAAAEALSRRLGAAVRGLSGAWYGRHMASAESAIRTRLALVDLVLEVRDARIPASSAFEPLCRPTLEPDGRRVIVLNKADLADPSETKKWIAYMKQRSCSCIAINSHNMESIKELLNIVRSRMREIKHGQSNCTGTVLLVGIPNVGKSAIVNVMHQIGRIAAEKGKLKHAIVSGHPGETRDISGYKVASHPNMYVLDTPGVLSSRFTNDDFVSRLALTGAIKDSLLQEYDIAQFLLALVNSHDEYKKWENLNQVGANVSFSITSTSRSQNKKRQYVSDHTQDFVVKSVRQILFDSVSSFKGGPGKEDAFSSLIDCQMVSLQEAFKVSTESSEDMRKSVALKLLNLYRTGRLGHYTLDHVPDDWQEVAA
ncbi:hypothetical protein PR202_ga07916 [Eleusine coracana subsp. coracana]|uniref:G domain-containing protein n=1 Tax=Eleusine coracana subsp. coracana TaxID=191504 RepID=A0AAV5BZA3_ELECO|nr:hypothetical protein PR202_ga07916 [Eleusine coracana subsp. coracana]